jgi:hypothetical protein
MAGVLAVEEEDSLDEKLFVDLLVVIFRVTELVRTTSLSRIRDVGLLFVVVKLGQGWWYLLVKGCLQVVGQRLVPG